MKISHLIYGLAGVAAGLLLAPKTGIWNKYLTTKTKQGQDMIKCGIKRTEAAVSEVAEGIIDVLETGRKIVAS